MLSGQLSYDLSNEDDSNENKSTEPSLEKDEYIKSLEISVQLLQQEISSLRKRILLVESSQQASDDSSSLKYIDQIKAARSLDELKTELNLALNNLFGISQSGLFMMNSSGSILDSDNSINSKLFSELVDFEENGILDWVLSGDKVVAIDSLSDSSQNSSSVILYYISRPGQNRILFAAKSSKAKEEINKRNLSTIASIASAASLVLDNIISSEEIKKINQQLSKSKEKSAPTSDLIAAISNEITGHIGLIKGNINFIKTGIGSTEKRFEIIALELENLDLISSRLSLLITSKSGEDTRELKNIVQESLILTRTQLQRDGIVIGDVNISEGSEISSNPLEVEQIILFLLLSSIDFLPEGGNLHIASSELKKDISLTINIEGATNLEFDSDENLIEISSGLQNALSISEKTDIELRIIHSGEEAFGAEGVGNGISFKVIIPREEL
jgi:hypothetical protein